MTMLENLEDNLNAVTVALAAILAAVGTFLFKHAKSRALVTDALGRSRRDFATADAEELAARGNLEERTRDWADRLIAYYDGEVDELRQAIIDLRREHAVEKREMEARYQARFAEMQAEIDALRLENATLRVENAELQRAIQQRQVRFL